MIKVAALTQGQLVPAARFRVRQNVQRLRSHNINVSEFLPEIDVYSGLPFNLHGWPYLMRFPLVAAWQGFKVGLRLPHLYQSRNHDVIWLQRELLPGYFTLERMIGSPIAFDVDDAIWLAKKNAASSISKIASISTVVIAGNEYIADWFSAYTKNVVVIPTAVDVDKYYPQVNHARNFFTIGWIGTRGNLSYLEALSPVLSKFLKKYDDAIISVVSDSPPRLPGVPEKHIQYIPWTELGEVGSIWNMDVGIMPLPDNEWTRGKCSFKMLQYMACGIPVVVSPVGMNRSVLELDDLGFGPSSHEEWFDALEFLYKNKTAGREMGARGRKVVTENYSTEIASMKLAEVFRTIG